MDHQYFDAKFEGMRDLMTSQHANLTAHINAVSSNVKRVEKALDDHKESTVAHGVGEGRRITDTFLKYGGFVIGTLGLIVAWRKHG